LYEVLKFSVVYNNRESTLSPALLVSCFLYFSIYIYIYIIYISVELIMLESEPNLKLFSTRSRQVRHLIAARSTCMIRWARSTRARLLV